MSTHRWLNCPNREVRTLSPAFKQLVSAASQQPVPDDGNRMGTPVVVLKIGLRPVRQGPVSSGKMGERWSSMGTIMARRTRSGTLVGPGTNRKFRPAIDDLLSVTAALGVIDMERHSHGYALGAHVSMIYEISRGA